MIITTFFLPDNILSIDDLKPGRIPSSKFGRILFHPVVKIFIGMAILSALNLINLQEQFFTEIQYGGKQLFYIINAAALLFLYYAFIRLVEKRQPHAIGLKRTLREIIKGFSGGAVLINILIIMVFISGYYSITTIQFSLDFLTLQVIKIFFFALLEEIIFRLIILRFVETLTGTTAAVLISSGIFGAAHFMNPGSTWFTTLLVTIQSISIISPAYLLTRRIWFVTALHFAWNFFQRAVWSLPVSGKYEDGIFRLSNSGPEFMTGGYFGPEASILSLVVCFISAYVFYKYRRLGGKKIF